MGKYCKNCGAETDDYTFNQLDAVIRDFDEQCEDYVNGVRTAPPSYLTDNAYTQQVAYKQKHPGMKQYYLSIDVMNARQANGFYYVWVTEELEVHRDGKTSITTDHWVYKLKNTNGDWYICDYTTDPIYVK